MNGTDAYSRTIFFVAGGLTGACAVLLLAPWPGSDLRRAVLRLLRGRDEPVRDLGGRFLRRRVGRPRGGAPRAAHRAGTSRDRAPLEPPARRISVSTKGTTMTQIPRLDKTASLLAAALGAVDIILVLAVMGTPISATGYLFLTLGLTALAWAGFSRLAAAYS